MTLVAQSREPPPGSLAWPSVPFQGCCSVPGGGGQDLEVQL